MKLLIILSIVEEQKNVAQLLHKAGLCRFSVVNITGYKKSEMCAALGWFGQGSACEKTNSLMMFSFTTPEIAQQVITQISQNNEAEEQAFPLHAFVLDVEQFAKIKQN